MKKTHLLAILALVLAAGLAFLFLRSDSQTKPTADKADSAEASHEQASETPPSSPPPALPGMLRPEADPKGSLRLEGLVLDSTDDPVAGATVFLSSNPPKSTTTGEDGSFAFEQLIARTYAITARKDERASSAVSHRLTDKSDPAVLKLKEAAKLRVEVRDQSDRVVSGADVQLRALAEQSMVTDGDGVALFRGVGPGTHFVVASASGLAPSRQMVQIPAGGAMTVRARLILQRGAPVSGVVVDDEGKPVADAKVAPFAATALFAGLDWDKDSVRSDQKGRFTIPAVAAGTYRFVALKDGASAQTEPQEVRGDQAVGGVEIRFPPSATLTGKVVDASQAPVAGAQVIVQARSAAGSFQSGTRRAATTDEKGAFELKGLPRGKLVALAMTDTASSEQLDFDLSTDHEKDITLTLTIEGVIAGKIVDSSDEPVWNAHIVAFPDFIGGETEESNEFLLRGAAETKSDPGGNFRFAGLPEGKYRIRASRSGGGERMWRTPGIPTSVGDTGVRIVLDKEGGIKGNLKTKQGERPELFTVIAGFPPGIPVVTEDGSFEVRDIPPGKYDISFQGPDFEEKTIRDVEIAPGKTTDMGTVEVSRGRAITGRIMDAGGRPVEGARVVGGIQIIGDGSALVGAFGAANEQNQRIRKANTDDEGRFRLVGVGQKELVVVAEHETKGRSIAVVATGAEADSDIGSIALQGYGKISGKVTMGGDGLAGAQVVAVHKSGSGNQMNVVISGQDGSFVFDRLASGELQLKALSSGLGNARAGSTLATLRPGQHLKTEIEIEVGELTVEVTIAGKGGVTIDAAQVFLFPGDVNVKLSKGIQDEFLKSSGAAQMGFAMAGKRASFSNVKPGKHSACAIPINGNMADPTFQKRLNDNRMTLDVHCQGFEFSATPTTQKVTMEVPPMSPLPE